MPPRLLWSPYLRCSPQMLRMKLPTKIPLENQPVRAGFFMPTIKKLADARDVILHELIGHLSCAVVNVKSMQANNVNHVCTKTEKAHLHPILEKMFAVAGK
ncbi:virulence protein MsgA homolog [Salmonella enterica subsp. enterica serovar Newport str. SL317]|nr:virulence protein MsgA homolog [Salmonella enterica subsp. enterica serovar Newport str. SL317]